MYPTPNVLVVDDDPDGCEVVVRGLEREGMTVRSAQNGREAIQFLVSLIPDVVILDAMMPELNGVGFLEVVRSYLRWTRLPVILLTAYPEGPHIEQARQLGVKYVFFKAEFKLPDLIAAVRDLAQHAPSESTGNMPEAKPGISSGHP